MLEQHHCSPQPPAASFGTVSGRKNGATHALVSVRIAAGATHALVSVRIAAGATHALVSVRIAAGATHALVSVRIAAGATHALVSVRIAAPYFMPALQTTVVQSMNERQGINGYTVVRPSMLILNIASTVSNVKIKTIFNVKFELMEVS